MALDVTGTSARRGADPALPAERRHAGAGADRALRDRPSARGRRAPARRRRPRRASCARRSARSRRTRPTTGITTQSSPTCGIGGARGVDRAVEDASDLHRRGQVDRRLDHAPLGDLEEARQLAGGVERRGAGRNRPLDQRRRVAGDDHRHPGARDAATRRVARARRARRSRARPGRPGTSVIAFSGPGSSEPMRDPARAGARAARRGRRGHRGESNHDRLAAVALVDPRRVERRAACCTAGRPGPGSACRSRGTRCPSARSRSARRSSGGRVAWSRRAATTTRRSSRCTIPVSSRFLRTAYAEWVAAGYPDDPGQPQVVGYLFPTAGLLAGRRAVRAAASPSARTGPVGVRHDDAGRARGPGRRARAAVDCALTAADLVRGRRARSPTRARGRRGTT